MTMTIAVAVAVAVIILTSASQRTMSLMTNRRLAASPRGSFAISIRADMQHVLSLMTSPGRHTSSANQTKHSKGIRRWETPKSPSEETIRGSSSTKPSESFLRPCRFRVRHPCTRSAALLLPRNPTDAESSTAYSGLAMLLHHMLLPLRQHSTRP
jgi:hypothetical protein